MKSYEVDYSFTDYGIINVEADTVDQARERAIDNIIDLYGTDIADIEIGGVNEIG